MRVKRLRFRDEFIPLILSGRKRATIRAERGDIEVGDVVYLTSLSMGRAFGKARITNITRKRVCELSDEDARKDGFRDRYILIEALKSIYGRDVEEMDIYVIEFELVR